MRKVLLIGVGMGDPDQLTLAAVNALNQVDVFFVNDKGANTADIVASREAICARHLRRSDTRIVHVDDPPRQRQPLDYAESVRAWHARRVERYEALLATEIPEHGCAGFLVWGDPSLYDSTIRMIDEIVRRRTIELDYQVIPGISSVQVLVARHKLTLNEIGGPVCITTGRRLLEETFAPEATVVVMLDGHLACQHLDPTVWDIFWGAYLGRPDEVLVAGPLGQVMDEIRTLRAHLRSEKGWIMDVYLLRRRVP